LRPQDIEFVDRRHETYVRVNVADEMVTMAQVTNVIELMVVGDYVRGRILGKIVVDAAVNIVHFFCKGEAHRVLRLVEDCSGEDRS